MWRPPPASTTPFKSESSEQASPTPGRIIRKPGELVGTPTPDIMRVLPTQRVETEMYTVQTGDALGKIAQRYDVSLKELIAANNIQNANLLEIGQVLIIPPPQPGIPGSNFKIIPDSELVYGPASAQFNIYGYVKGVGGYLASYREEINGERMGGPAIVERVSQEYSVNPRLLIAVLEYQSGWLTKSSPPHETLDYPMGVEEPYRKGLYNQLAWAANTLNHGYYLWRVNGIGRWVLTDGSVISIDPTINAGTAAVQGFFATLYDLPGWEYAVSEHGLFADIFDTYGYPFDYAIEPLIPDDLSQPNLQLPFEPGLLWAFTGGPHGGWGSGSAWAALDFAPPGEGLGCVQSDYWVTAVADGFVIRSGRGAIIQDLDGDGLESTGWTILYMHIESRDRVSEGTYVRAGDRIGHPSCEGGFSSGTHLHLARRYNGEWIAADQQIPFIMDGWVSKGIGSEYEGYLVRDGESVEAWEGYFPINQIQR